VPALIAAHFEVTCITRPNSKATLPDGVAVKTADYTDIEALVAGLQGQDALVEAFNPVAASHQALILQAALATGVRHIITPDFSGDTFNTNADELLIFDTKRRAQRELESVVAASGNKLSWTAIIVGPWYDWTIERGFFWIDRNQRVITRYDSGDQKYSISRLALAGEALVAVLEDTKKYRNRPAYFASHTITTNRLIAIVKDLGLKGWTVIDGSIDGYMEKAHKLWQRDTEIGVENRLVTKAYEMFATLALLNGENRYGSDFSDRAEPGWDEGEAALREDLRKLLVE
jgi:hypothetical protein